MTNQLSFVSVDISGELTEKFLQGQITADTEKLVAKYQLTAICNLKGKVQFGFWIAKKDSNTFETIISADCVEDFLIHIKKYGAFSRLNLSEPKAIAMVLQDDMATFAHDQQSIDENTWLQHSIKQGQFAITQETSEKLQPQELRLHQIGEVGGVHYDKGCYIGQEPVARLWFKAQPKAWLHRVYFTAKDDLFGDNVSRNIKPVNFAAVDNGFEALVVAIPKALIESNLTILDLPDGLNGSVARNAQ